MMLLKKNKLFLACQAGLAILFADLFRQSFLLFEKIGLGALILTVYSLGALFETLSQEDYNQKCKELKKK